MFFIYLAHCVIIYQPRWGVSGFLTWNPPGGFPDFDLEPPGGFLGGFRMDNIAGPNGIWKLICTMNLFLLSIVF